MQEKAMVFNLSGARFVPCFKHLLCAPKTSLSWADDKQGWWQWWVKQLWEEENGPSSSPNISLWFILSQVLSGRIVLPGAPVQGNFLA